MNFFGVGNIAFQVLGYSVSYVELIGTLFGLISVYFAAKGKILTWPTGVVNEVFLFILFFQVQLYADMFLQVFFLAVTIYGWYNWRTVEKEDVVRVMRPRDRVFVSIGILGSSLMAGALISRIHLYFPDQFKVPAAYPYTDSFIMMASVFATWLLARKKLENWVVWVIVDLVATVLYFMKGVNFLGLEYFIFLIMASYGFHRWRKKTLA